MACCPSDFSDKTQVVFETTDSEELLDMQFKEDEWFKQ